MSSDLLSILKSMIVLMQVNKPGIVSGISGNNILGKYLGSGLFSLRGDVASILYVLYSQRRL